MTDAQNLFDLLIDKFRAVVKEELNAAASPKELLTPEELAGKLKIPVSWVYEQSRQDNIPTHRLGRYIRFDLREVLQSQVCKKKVIDAT